MRACHGRRCFTQFKADAVTVQTIWRRFAAQTAFADARRAAVSIQCAARVAAAFARRAELLVAAKRAFLLVVAVRRIQAALRARLAARRSAVVIQRVVRAYCERREALVMHRAAAVAIIQRVACAPWLLQGSPSNL